MESKDFVLYGVSQKYWIPFSQLKRYIYNTSQKKCNISKSDCVPLKFFYEYINVRVLHESKQDMLLKMSDLSAFSIYQKFNCITEYNKTKYTTQAQRFYLKNTMQSQFFSISFFKFCSKHQISWQLKRSTSIGNTFDDLIKEAKGT